MKCNHCGCTDIEVKAGDFIYADQEKSQTEKDLEYARKMAEDQKYGNVPLGVLSRLILKLYDAIHRLALEEK